MNFEPLNYVIKYNFVFGNLEAGRRLQKLKLRMRIYVSVDLEGIHGVDRYDSHDKGSFIQQWNQYNGFSSSNVMISKQKNAI